MTISEFLFDAFSYCGQKNINFHLINSDLKENVYHFDAENKLITVTIGDYNDKEFVKTLQENFEQLKQTLK
jgi:hypothetical protein